VRVGGLVRASLVGVAVVGLATFYGAPSLASTEPPRVVPTCVSLAQSPVVYRAGSVVVYRTAIRGDGGEHDWACSSRPRSPLVSASPLGTASGLGFAPRMTVGHFSADGPWLVDLASSKAGWRSCFASTRPCRREHHEIELTDVVDSSQTSTSSKASVDIHLSVLPARDGRRTAAVAWTQPAPGSLIALKFITAQDRQGSGAFGLNRPVVGRIDPRSVRLHGLRVSFIENGRHRVIKLGV
jgi:hypothetical protein